MSYSCFILILAELEQKRKDPEGNTVGLLKRMCHHMAGTAKVLVLDSGLSVLNALVSLQKMGIFAHAVIKKKSIGPSLSQAKK